MGELRDVLRAIGRLWFVVVAAVVVAVAVMWAITPLAVDTTRKVNSYQAIAVLLVQEPPTSSPTPTPSPAPTAAAAPSPSPQATETPDPARAVNRVALLVHKGEIPYHAARALGDAGDPVTLAGDIKVTADTDTDTVFISMQGKDGQRITDVVNAFAQETARYFELPRPEVFDSEVTLVDEARPLPLEPAQHFVVPPDRSQRLVIAALLGLLAGATMAVLLGLLDARLRTAKDVRRIIGLPVLAEVPRRKRSQQEPRWNARADAYRIAESTLASMPRSTGNDLSLILMTSAQRQENVADSVVRLADAFAEAGSSVLVVEANLRAPAVAPLLDVPEGVGAAEWVAGPDSSSLATLVRPTAIPGVRLITSGSAIAEPAALASRLGPLLTEARSLADYVIVHAPPLLAASEVYDLLATADAVVLVVGYNTVTASVGNRIGEMLRRFDGVVLSALLVGVPSIRRRRRDARRIAATARSA